MPKRVLLLALLASLLPAIQATPSGTSGHASSETYGSIDATGSCGGFPEALCRSNFANVTPASASGCEQPSRGRPIAHLAANRSQSSSLRYSSNPDASRNQSTTDDYCALASVACLGIGGEPIQSLYRTTTAVWTASEKALLMPCLETKGLYSFDLTGESFSTMPPLMYEQEESLSLIKSSYSDYAIEFGDGELKVYTTKEKASHSYDLKQARNSDWTVNYVRDWHITPNAIYVLADLRTKAPKGTDKDPHIDDWRLSLVRIDRSSFSFDILYSVAALSNARQYFKLATSFIAESRGIIYALFPGNPTRLIRVDCSHEVDELDLPTQIGRAKNFSFGEEKNITSKYLAMASELDQADGESSVFPVALLGWNGGLFLQFMQGGAESRWTLAKLNIDREIRITTTPIPSGSPRIILVPGRTSWAIIEHAIGDPTTRSEKEVPTSIKLWSFREAEQIAILKTAHGSL